MSTEEVYIRSFVTAGALASAVAFVVIVIGLLGRKRLGETGLGIVGGVSLALAWMSAHLAMQGLEAWADLLRSGNGWKRFFWPIEATERFPVFVLLALAGGVIAALTQRKRAAGSVLRWTIRICTIGGTAWVAAIPRAGSELPLTVMGTLIGIAWWIAMEDAEPREDGALAPMTAAVCSAGFGALALMEHAATLGLLSLCGALALCVLALAGARYPKLIRGPTLCAVVAGVWVAILVGAMTFASDWPWPSLILVCAAPLTPALFSSRWITKRPAWHRWVAQMALTCLLAGTAVILVYWDHHDLRLEWPF